MMLIAIQLAQRPHSVLRSVHERRYPMQSALLLSVRQSFSGSASAARAVVTDSICSTGDATTKTSTAAVAKIGINICIKR